MTTSDGTQDASSHEPKFTCRPCSAASPAPIGLPDVAVNQSAEVIARLAMPQNIR
ncbi:MAG: hypothetical protein AW07_03965 [Candidatus Accumulibacter sp. SK-11]|nr:MAG: hypothetical protein AW07_03965 [Candidatus Accumulibacter sp. SK-11]